MKTPESWSLKQGLHELHRLDRVLEFRSYHGVRSCAPKEYIRVRMAIRTILASRCPRGYSLLNPAAVQNLFPAVGTIPCPTSPCASLWVRRKEVEAGDFLCRKCLI